MDAATSPAEARRKRQRQTQLQPFGDAGDGNTHQRERGNETPRTRLKMQAVRRQRRPHQRGALKVSNGKTTNKAPNASAAATPSISNRTSKPTGDGATGETAGETKEEEEEGEDQ